MGSPFNLFELKAYLDLASALAFAAAITSSEILFGHGL